MVIGGEPVSVGSVRPSAPTRRAGPGLPVGLRCGRCSLPDHSGIARRETGPWPGRNEDNAKAQVVVPDRRRVPVAVRRPAAPAAEVPAAAPGPPIRALRRPGRVALRVRTVIVLAIPIGTP